MSDVKKKIETYKAMVESYMPLASFRCLRSSRLLEFKNNRGKGKYYKKEQTRHKSNLILKYRLTTKKL